MNAAFMTQNHGQGCKKCFGKKSRIVKDLGTKMDFHPYFRVGT